jgi:hypothetical protein
MKRLLAITLAKRSGNSFNSVMTEMTKTIDIMPKTVRRFILHWGDMRQQ